MGCLAHLAAAALLLAAHVSEAAELRAGGFSFSDERGGFRLLAATGAGTRTDPIVIVEEFDDAAPATVVIRRLELPSEQIFGMGELHLVKKVVNRSGRVWAGFEIELQERAGHASTYTDGLSFKQLDARDSDVASDVFIVNERRFEPEDRIEFTDGFLNPDAAATFRMVITDPTPRLTFFLVQDPKVLSASASEARFAAR